MERIVIGYDGSPAADSALEWVVDRAHRHPARVDVIGVANPFAADKRAIRERLEKAEELLRVRIPGLPVESHQLDGLMPAAFIDAAFDADLIVMGIERNRPIRAALHGWMPQRAAARTRSPLCLVPTGWTATAGPVVVGVDVDSSSAAIDFAAGEADEQRSSLRMAHVWPPAAGPAERDHSGSVATRTHTLHEQVLEAAARRIRTAFPRLRVETALVRHEDPGTAMLFAAADESPALVVLGTHRRGVLAGAFLGSVTQTLLWESQVAVVVVPDPERLDPRW